MGSKHEHAGEYLSGMIPLSLWDRLHIVKLTDRTNQVRPRLALFQKTFTFESEGIRFYLDYDGQRVTATEKFRLGVNQDVDWKSQGEVSFNVISCSGSKESYTMTLPSIEERLDWAKKFY